MTSPPRLGPLRAKDQRWSAEQAPSEIQFHKRGWCMPGLHREQRGAEANEAKPTKTLLPRTRGFLTIQIGSPILHMQQGRFSHGSDLLGSTCINIPGERPQSKRRRWGPRLTTELKRCVCLCIQSIQSRRSESFLSGCSGGPCEPYVVRQPADRLDFETRPCKSYWCPGTLILP